MPVKIFEGDAAIEFHTRLWRSYGGMEDFQRDEESKCWGGFFDGVFTQTVILTTPLRSAVIKPSLIVGNGFDYQYAIVFQYHDVPAGGYWRAGENGADPEWRNVVKMECERVTITTTSETESLDDFLIKFLLCLK